MPLHIMAERVAEDVVVVGDPGRARTIAGMMRGARTINENRGLLAFTGRYRDHEVSVVTHGMGSPSAAIVIEEIVRIGARRVVRLGTAGSLGRLKVGEILVALAASAQPGGIYSSYYPNMLPPLAPCPRLTEAILKKARALGIEVSSGVVFSSDAFYVEDVSWASTLRKRGIDAVEMECAALFMLGWFLNISTACVLVVTNVVGEGALHAVDNSIKAAATLVLEALSDERTVSRPGEEETES